MVIWSGMLAVCSRAGAVLARRARRQTPCPHGAEEVCYCAGGAATGGLGLGCFFGAAAGALACAVVFSSGGGLAASADGDVGVHGPAPAVGFFAAGLASVGLASVGLVSFGLASFGLATTDFLLAGFSGSA